MVYTVQEQINDLKEENHYRKTAIGGIRNRISSLINLIFNGAIFSYDRQLTHVGSPHSALPEDSQVGVDTTTAIATYELPAVATSEGRNIFIYDWGQNASVNPITIAAQGGETINGLASIDIIIDGAGAWCKCQGGVWKTVAPV